MIRFLFSLILLFVLSCVERGGIISDSVEFKKTMSIEVNGLKSEGVLVVPKALHYKIKIKINSRAKIIKLNSCHRELTIQKAGWFGRMKHTFEFDASAGIENSGFCPIAIESFDKGGWHEFALIEIRNKKLSAGLFCNGDVSAVKGVSLCQARVGLVQRITFSDKVTYLADNCGSVTTSDNLTFDFTPDDGICVVMFFDGAKNEFHRLTIFGFNEIILNNIDSENHFPSEDDIF